MTGAAEPRSVEVGGATVRYRVAGDGPPLVLVHGLAGSTAWWVRNVPALAARHRVYLVDLPGFGAMRGSARRFVLAEAPGWLGQWLEVAVRGPAALAGHSMGAIVALRLAAMRPALVSRLVLVAPAGIPSGRRLAGHVLPLAASLWRRPPWLVARVAGDALAAGPLTLARAGLGVLAEDVRADLRGLDVSVLAVWGERDPLVPLRLRAEVERALPRARHAVVAGAGHIPMAERPQDFDRIVLDFLAEDQSAAPMTGSASAATAAGAE